MSDTALVKIDYYELQTMLLIYGHISHEVIACDLSHVRNESQKLGHCAM